MNFVSFGFLLFLFGTVVIYYLVPKKIQWAFLLIVNYVFYFLSGAENLAFILFTTLLTYGAGLFMQKLRTEGEEKLRALGSEIAKAEKKAMKKAVNARIHRVQAITILLCLLVLGYCKYMNFLIGNANAILKLFRWDASIPLVNVIVPLGISFYTFASIGYVIDIGRGRYEAERHLGKYALFISFFPTVVQGPICKYNEVGKQLGEEHRFDLTKIRHGAILILWGFFLKIVIADRASYLVNTIYKGDTLAKYSGSVFFFGMLAYACQIYCDFSGGINITRGAAGMLGIDLPLNFERPYFSQSVSEYWRRWHITLGAWMRDYVFYPVMLSKPVSRLSGFARKHISAYAGRVVPTVVTPFVVFFLIGIWHGASLQYIAFGLYNAVVVAGGVALTPVFQKLTLLLKINKDTFSWKLFCGVRTFLLTGISKILVISPGLRAALQILKKIFTDVDWDFVFNLDGSLYELGLNSRNIFILFFSVCVLLVVSILQEKGIKIRETLDKQNLYFRWAIYILLLFSILTFGVYGPGYDAAGFIYEAY